MDKFDKNASVPFIPRHDQMTGCVCSLRQSEKPRWTAKRFMFLQVCLILLYTFMSILVIGHHARCPENLGPSLTWSPAQHLVQWETRPVDGHRNDSIFAQEPGPEVDLAWRELLSNINLRILPQELQRLGYDSLRFQDGSGSLGTIAVYHELHCLKRIRWWLHRDYYYPDMTSDEELEHWTHADHCLELLRQASICKADTTVIPFKWLHSGVGTHGVGPTTQEGIHHQCVEWEPIEKWAKERRVDLYDPDLLVWPENGDV